MNPNAPFEQDLEQWLQAEAPASAPAGFHATVMDRARTLPQRPGWATTLPAPRFGRGRGITLLAAAALLLVGGALAAGSGLLRLPSVVPPVPEPSVIAVATASPDATSPSPSGSAAPSASPIPSAAARSTGARIATGTMISPRSNHSAVRLLDGRVLVVGGWIADSSEEDNRRDLTSAELYDPKTGTWSATGDMLTPHEGFPATLLRDGKVLIGAQGGRAQVYDPSTGTWAATGAMVRCCGDTATRLLDGKVLVIGHDDTGELYDPDRGTWTATEAMTTPRHSHTAILLPDGRVLVAGGHAPRDEPTNSAELYDPDTGSWTATASMHVKREFIVALPRSDGTVLVIGSSLGNPISVELYDAATATWTAVGETASDDVIPGPATLLADGTVLLADVNGAALFHPTTGAWTTTAPMLRLHGAPAILLLDGTVLVAGGSECNGDDLCDSTGATELYIPAGVSPPPLPAFPSLPRPSTSLPAGTDGPR